MHTENNGKDEACKGKIAKPGSICGEGLIELILSLEEDERRRCGTKHYSDGANVRTYDNLIVAAEHSGQYTKNDLSFRTYCKFISQARQTFKGIAVNALVYSCFSQN